MKPDDALGASRARVSHQRYVLQCMPSQDTSADTSGPHKQGGKDKPSQDKGLHFSHSGVSAERREPHVPRDFARDFIQRRVVPQHRTECRPQTDPSPTLFSFFSYLSSRSDHIACRCSKACLTCRQGGKDKEKYKGLRAVRTLRSVEIPMVAARRQSASLVPTDRKGLGTSPVRRIFSRRSGSARRTLLPRRRRNLHALYARDGTGN